MLLSSGPFGDGGRGGVQVHYQEHAFEFQLSEGMEFTGRLLLDDHQSELLAALTATEDEGWYLDDNGERLPPEALFARTPWSCPGPSGPVKLLCRWLDLRDGTARFNTLELYGGELFRWLRAGGQPSEAEQFAAAVTAATSQ